MTSQEILDLLAPHISERRRERIDQVVTTRCKSIVPVLDGIFDTGNIAAVLRTAEGLGALNAHIIDTQPVKKVSARVTQGADKWLDLTTWKDPTACVTHLQSQGFQVVATHLEAAVPLETIDFTRPTALVLGNERDGVCEEVAAAADHRCIIPMRGFVQSFNISVAGALSMYEATRQRQDKLGKVGDLSAREMQILKAVYYLRAVNQGERLVTRLLGLQA
ncbi:TrmH family RNA methyltransferase [Lujinxingia litoralis]|nr:RNA methyltransferase [Lujinxingia litoralis]